MITDNYVKLRPGHVFQMMKTRPGPSYDENYISYWKGMDNLPLTKIRYDLLTKTIGKFNSILDFGYGNADFLIYCKQNGKQCYGYDITEFPLPKGISFVKNFYEKKVDVFSFFDSLEHIHQSDLVSFLQPLETKYLIISVPHYHEDLGINWFRQWKHRKPNEHFHHFDSHGLTLLLNESGYKVLYIGNDEDQIRKSADNTTNILTIIASK